jgi:hypothetical protein
LRLFLAGRDDRAGRIVGAEGALQGEYDEA